MTAYIDAADVIDRMTSSSRPTYPPDSGSDDEARVVAITNYCTSTAEMIDAEASWDFHRHPANTNDDPISWIVDGRGSARLHAHYGIVEVDSIDVRFSQSSDWEALEADEWELVSMYLAEDETRPYDHIDFTSRLPTVKRGVRLNGVRGWAAVPERLKEMNISWVRQLLGAGDSYSGALQVPDTQVITIPRLVLPDPVRIFLNRESDRYAECWT